MASAHESHPIGPWWFAYVLFVIYGSLVPLDYRPLPWDQAWSMFQHIRLLDVGAVGRADWIANGVLYLPVGFLTASVLSGARQTSAPLPAILGAIVFVAALAVAIEFAQLAFPPRTVSLNDLLAELLGGTLGASLAGMASHRFTALRQALTGTADRLLPRLLEAYAIAYCAFSLFPYDFLLSTAELAEKSSSPNWGWIWASASADGTGAVVTAKLAAETIAALPLGLLLASRGKSPGRAVLVGLALGVAIEFAQFFLVSGVSQGLSVMTRTAGIAAGAFAWQRCRRLNLTRLGAGIRRIGPLLIASYLLTLAAVTGWLELDWHGIEAATATLRNTRFLPFYYHYYTTEQAALLSLTAAFLMYAPVGVMAWAYFLGPGTAAFLAVLAAVIMETSKLFLAGLHPDPTNLLLAAIGASMACRLARNASRLAKSAGASKHAGNQRQRGSPMHQVPEQEVPKRTASSSASREPSLTRRGAAILLAGAVLAGLGVMRFPLQPVLLGLALFAYACAVWSRPQWMWVVIPAALALLDLAPWSGRFFWDEFDLLLLVSVTVGFARLPATARNRRDRLLTAALGLIALAYAIAMIRGLLPWQGLDANSFSNYYSPFNALRIFKGVAWALALAVLACRFDAAGIGVRRLVGTGMVVGLAGTTAVVIWERWAFPGLFNFSDVYRVTGPFSQMHTGGADLETFLAAATPFLVWRLFERRNWLERGLGIVLLTATTYAVMVTYSRAGYLAFGTAVLLTALVAVMRPNAVFVRGWIPRVAAFAGVLAVTVAAATPIGLGSFAKERVARSGTDLVTRIAHWRDALAMRDGDLATQLLGMGLGSFPATHFWRSSEARAAGYQIIREDDTTFLRLGSGSPVYIEQSVAAQPRASYRLTMRARSPSGGASVSVSLCEKWLLTSARCVFGTAEPATSDWQTVTVTLPTGELGNSPWYRFRPVKLSVFNSGPDGLIDVTDLQLAGTQGRQLLQNGDFLEGMDHWFFAADVDLPWHIWSLPVSMLFEMGSIGAGAVGIAILAILLRGARSIGADGPYGAAWLVVWPGLLVLGSVDSLTDSPRILMLLLLLLAFVPIVPRARNVAAGHGRRNRRAEF